MRRVHWFRTSALACRWREEKLLLEEEMRRTIRFFVHFREHWLTLSRMDEAVGDDARAAYACKYELS